MSTDKRFLGGLATRTVSTLLTSMIFSPMRGADVFLVDPYKGKSVQCVGSLVRYLSKFDFNLISAVGNRLFDQYTYGVQW